MNSRTDRQEFARSRPLPPFGVVLKWLSDILQLRDPGTYDWALSPITDQNDLRKALDELGSRTADDIFAGLIVKDETKKRMSRTLAVCLRELPNLYFGLIPVAQLSEWITESWRDYEHASGLLSSISENRDKIETPLARHMVVEMAVRAGALAYLCGDTESDDLQPVWSQDAELKPLLRKLMKIIGTREDKAAELVQSKSEIGRWLDDLDIPAASNIQRWEQLLKAGSGVPDKMTGKRALRRLYVGRRVWNSSHRVIPQGVKSDAVRAYCRIKRTVHRYLLSEKKLDSAEDKIRAVTIALRGRISDPSLAANVFNAETDVVWRRHVEAVFQIKGTPTVDISRVCQTWAAVHLIYEQVPASKRPATFDEFIRSYYLKAERGGTPSAEYAKYLEEMNRRESVWDIEGAATCAIRLVQLAPLAAGAWHGLGRMRRYQKNKEATEWCFRKALELDPTSMEVRTDLAVHFALSSRVEDARKLLEACTDEQQTHVEWRFAQGTVLLSSQRYREALSTMLECAREGFVPSVCYQFAAIAAEALELPKETREYRKRAAELGVRQHTPANVA